MFSFDNPGGRWLFEKQAHAAKDYGSSQKGLSAKAIRGSTTAWTRRPVMVNVDYIRDLGGVNNEARQPGDHQYDDLSRRVQDEGWDPQQAGNAILIGVNHFGEAYLIEGNTRLAMAKDLGIEEIRAEVRWYNGAEAVSGPLSLSEGVFAQHCRPAPEPEDTASSPEM